MYTVDTRLGMPQWTMRMSYGDRQHDTTPQNVRKRADRRRCGNLHIALMNCAISMYLSVCSARFLKDPDVHDMYCRARYVGYGGIGCEEDMDNC